MLRQHTHNVYAARRHYGRSIDVHITEHDAGGMMVGIAQPLTFVKVEPDAGSFGDDPPALSMHPDVAQRLMDELWSAGLRPTQGQQSEGQFAAQGKHLDDMRALVKKMAQVELP